MKAFCVAASWIVMGIAALVLAGWALDITAFKSVLPNLVAMKANTAIGFLLSGLALLLSSLNDPGKSLRLFTAAIAGIVAALGAITLSEYLFGWNPGIDQWLFHEAPNAVWTPYPGRMAPATAFCFVLVGSALAAASQPSLRWRRLPLLAGLGASVTVIAGLALAGCLSQALLSVTSWNDSGMAIHAALAFLLLGCALLATAVGSHSFAWSLGRFVTIGFVIAIASMIVAAGISYQFTNQLLEAATQVGRTQEVFKEIEEVAEGLAKLESAQRGYIVLGDEHLIATREQTIADLREDLASLHRLTAADPVQERRLAQLDALIPQRLDFGDRTITVRRQEGFPAAQRLASTGRGGLLTEEIDRLLKKMRDDLYASLDQQQQQSRTASTSTFLILPLGVFLSLAFSSLALFFLNDGVSGRVRMEKAWHESEERFQTVIENLTEGLVISGLDGQLLHWNPAALALHGLSSDEDARRNLGEISGFFELSTLDGAPIPLDQWPMSRVIRGEKLRDVSLRVRRLDTDFERVFSYSGSIVTEPGGQKLAFLTMFDITERTRSEEALRASEVQLGSFVEQAPISMAMFDCNMICLAASRRWVTDFGRGHTNLVGKCHYDVHPDVPAAWREVHRQGIAGIPSRCDEELWIRADGNRAWLRWAIQPWRDARGAVGGILILAENITDRKQAQQIQLENLRLEEENRRVAEGSRMKSEFLANMSHELRTPLNGIIGFTELMVDQKPGPLNTKQKEYLGDVLNSSRHLLQLINDVLDLAKVEAGKFDFQPETFLLAQAIDEACAVVRGLAKKKRIDLKIAVTPPLDSVVSDPRRFRQICYNLLSNAVKFTDAGGSVEIVALARDAEYFELRVTDTGIGIKEEDMERLFREFEQLEGGASRRYEGTGLGLALTRKLAELQGGSIFARSEYGKGSTFTVILPRHCAKIEGEGI